jgi:hypothetical protein
MKPRQFTPDAPARACRPGHVARVARAALAFACIGGIGGLGTVAGASPAAAATHGTPFAVYDNTFYSNVDLGRVGAVRSNVVYEAPVAQLAGQDPAKYRGARPAGAELALPPRAAYENLVRRTAAGPGPIVLDFETLYLRGSSAVAHRRFQKLQTLLAWAHQAAPGRVIGYYGVLGNTASRYLPLERRLAVHEDALFPSLYTFGDDLAVWKANFHRIMAEAKSVAHGKRVYAYLWPQYHGGAKRAGEYLTPAHWRSELDAATKLCAGVVIWGPSASDPDQRWVGATAGFLSTRR